MIERTVAECLLEKTILYTSDPILPTVEVLLPSPTAKQIMVTQELFRLADNLNALGRRAGGIYASDYSNLATRVYGGALGLQHTLEEERIDFDHLIRDSLNPEVQAQVKSELGRRQQSTWGGIY